MTLYTDRDLSTLHRIHKAGRELAFIWVPSHKTGRGKRGGRLFGKGCCSWGKRIELVRHDGLLDYTSFITPVGKGNVAVFKGKGKEGEVLFYDTGTNRGQSKKKLCLQKKKELVVFTRLTNGLRSGPALMGKRPEMVRHIFTLCYHSLHRRRLFKDLGVAGEIFFSLRVSSWTPGLK